MAASIKTLKAGVNINQGKVRISTVQVVGDGAEFKEKEVENIEVMLNAGGTLEKRIERITNQNVGSRIIPTGAAKGAGEGGSAESGPGAPLIKNKP